MKYNHKATQSLVDKAKADGKDVRKVLIHIDEVQRKQVKTGDYIITLVNKDDSQRYSAFESVWNAQNINIDDLNEGDEMEVTFAMNGDYRNFLKVEIPVDDNPLGFTC